MKATMIAALAAAQLLASAPPAAAADFAEARDVRVGAFAGVRLHMPLGADPERRGIQAGLAIGPIQRSTTMNGHSRTQFGDGLELGFSQRRPLTLSLAGRPMDRLAFAPNGRGPDGRRANVSTAGWIAIGVGTTVVVVGVATFIVFNHIRNNEDE
jgi:hypothetical protein